MKKMSVLVTICILKMELCLSQLCVLAIVYKNTFEYNKKTTKTFIYF